MDLTNNQLMAMKLVLDADRKLSHARKPNFFDYMYSFYTVTIMKYIEPVKYKQLQLAISAVKEARRNHDLYNKLNRKYFVL